MNRKKFADSEIEQLLEEFFDVPESPEHSEDYLESDDEGKAQYSTVKLQSILESLDAGTENISISFLESHNSLQPSVSEFDCQPLYSVQEICSPGPSSSRVTQSRPSTGPSYTVKSSTLTSSSVPDDTSSESDTDQSDDDKECWKKVHTANWADRTKPETFDKTPLAPKRKVGDRTRSLRFFEKFFSNEVYEQNIYQTNLYAAQEKIENWSPLKLPELKAFIGIIIVMGYHILPSIDLYWSSDPGFRVNEIADIMPVKRFKKILRCLHLNDNRKQPKKQP
ncbi:unnamed protein product [Parnassius apollo]|uniref:(apollo) hypothetical protein n=1 Tax=Parnassius apollo TaxID=110799 RepID=A0A8S3Y426_PARAO|nr:unnamed protein product [Parnassius apollo]